MAKDVISDKVVYERNEKMFEEFLRRMRSDDEAYFLDWVPKFKQWLGNPKAYYKAARPKIVEILETAGDTITRLNNSLPFETQDGINPSIESRRMAFITLVQAVGPHNDHFIEPQLQLRLGLLYARVNGRSSRERLPISSSTQQNPSSHLTDTIDPRSLTLNKASATSPSTRPTGFGNHAIGALERDVKKEPESDAVLSSRLGQAIQPSTMPTAVPMPTPISRVRKRNGRSGGSKSQSPVDAMNGSAPTQGPTTPKQPLPPSLSRRNTPASSLFQTPAARSSLGTSQDPILVGDVDDGDDVEIVEIVSKSAPREQPPVSRALSATVISPPTTPPVPQKPTAVQPSSTPSNLNPTRTKPTLPPLQTSATQTSQSHNSTMPISPSSSNFPSALPQTPSHPPPISLPAISATTPQVNVLPPLHSPTASISTIASGTSSNTQKKRGKTKKKPLLSAVGAPSASAMPWAQDDLKWYKEHKGQRGDGASPVGGSPVVSNATPTAASPIVPTATTITTSGPTFRQLEQPPISASGDGRTPMDVDSVSQHGVQPSGKAPSGSSTAVQSDMSGSRQVSGTGSNGAVAAADDLPMEVDNEQSGQNKAPLHGGNVTQPPRDGITPGVVSAMPDPRDYAKMQAEPAFSVAPSFDTSPARPGYPQAGTVYNDAMMAPMSPSSSSLTGALGDTVIHRTTPSVSSRSVILSANPPVGRTEHAPDPVHVRKGSSGPSRSVSVSADAPAIQPERATETAMVVDVANENVAGDVMVLNDVPTMDDVATTSDEPPNTDMEISQPEPVSEPFPSNDIVEHLPAQDEGAASNEIVPVVEPAGDHVPHRAASPGAPLANGRLDQASIVASTPPPPPSMNGFSDLEMAHDDDTHSLGDSPLARARALSPAISVVTNASSSSKLSVIDPDASHFNSDTVISLGITRGDIAGKIVEFDLVINSEQAKPISLWCRRHEHEADVYIGVCLSLACYVPKSSIPADGEYDERVLTPKLLNLHPQWPSKRQLLAVVESTKRGQTCLCLSPPDMATEDGFVDISSFVGEGDNVIKFWMGEDMSDLVFVLFAHPPTKAQLRSLAERRAKEREWQRFLDNVSAPLDLPDIEMPKGRRSS